MCCWHASMNIISCNHSIVIIALSCIIATYSQILVENCEIDVPHQKSISSVSPPDTYRILLRYLVFGKLKSIGLSYAEENMMICMLHCSISGAWRMGGWTDRQTDGRTEVIYQYHMSALLCWCMIKILVSFGTSSLCLCLFSIGRKNRYWQGGHCVLKVLESLGKFSPFFKALKFPENRFGAWKFWNLAYEVLESAWIS